MTNSDRPSVLNTLASLDHVILEPRRWSAVIDRLAQGMNATGGLMITPVSFGELPSSDGASEAMDLFWREGWQQHDFRRRGLPIFQRGGAAIDKDIVTKDEYETLPLVRGLLKKIKLPWWCGVGFNDGSTTHILSFLRSDAQGVFEREDAEFLQMASARLTQIATISRVAENKALASVTSAFASMSVPVVGVDVRGDVVGFNELFDTITDRDLAIKSGRLHLRCEHASKEYEAARSRLRGSSVERPTACDPIVVRRERKAPLLLTIIPISSLTGSIFGNAHMLVLVKEIAVKRSFPEGRISRAFSLTRTESRLVSVLMSGLTVSEAAGELGIAVHTARVHLRSVFLKTGTGRQSELLRLVATIG